MPITLEKALSQALTFETRIRDLYTEAARKSKDQVERSFFELLRDDEAGHVQYLMAKLEEWRKDGKISFGGLSSAVPSRKQTEEAVGRVAEKTLAKGTGVDTMAMSRALKAEEETSAYYRSLVGKIPGEADKLFQRFLEIEEGHTAYVRLELDTAVRWGRWFEYKEFDQEY